VALNALALDTQGKRIFVVDGNQHSIYAVDLAQNRATELTRLPDRVNAIAFDSDARRLYLAQLKKIIAISPDSPETKIPLPRTFRELMGIAAEPGKGVWLADYDLDTVSFAHT
jgi:hypothetical protein